MQLWLTSIVRVFLICAALWLAANCQRAAGPHRKPGIPPTAVWIGSRDSGNWVFCEALDAQGRRQLCKVFDGQSGQTLSSGEYVLRRIFWNNELQQTEYEEVGAAPQLQFQSFDGQRIVLADQFILLPDGWIDYPTGNGHGRRQQYKAGVEIGEARPY